MDIRRLDARDAEKLAVSIATLIPDEERNAGIASVDHLKRALANDACYFLAGFRDSTPVAYLSAFRFPSISSDAWQVYLFDIVVAEEHRRQGIGKRMIEALKRLCADDGVEYIWLGTSLDNEAGQKTFEATGGRRVSETYIEYEYDLRI